MNIFVRIAPLSSPPTHHSLSRQSHFPIKKKENDKNNGQTDHLDVLRLSRVFLPVCWHRVNKNSKQTHTLSLSLFTQSAGLAIERNDIFLPTWCVFKWKPDLMRSKICYFRRDEKKKYVRKNILSMPRFVCGVDLHIWYLFSSSLLGGGKTRAQIRHMQIYKCNSETAVFIFAEWARV